MCVCVCVLKDQRLTEELLTLLHHHCCSPACESAEQVVNGSHGDTTPARLVMRERARAHRPQIIGKGRARVSGKVFLTQPQTSLAGQSRGWTLWGSYLGNGCTKWRDSIFHVSAP